MYIDRNDPLHKRYNSIYSSGDHIWGCCLWSNKWKRELQGKVYLETSKQLLTALYGVRNNFEIVRSGWRDVSEFPEDYIKNKKASSRDPEIEADALWYLYKNRLSPLTEAMNSLDVCLLEAEALWGEEVREQGRKINGCYNRLVRSIKEVVAMEYRGGGVGESNATKGYKDDVIASRESSDELSNQLTEAINYFESITRKHLNR
ncbi:MAG: hypothetical protein GKR94_00640 [Gammaproteobacteria bacterium]|nr:hypothetical protein [Gammaproteobacteria bacterium]